MIISLYGQSDDFEWQFIYYLLPNLTYFVFVDCFILLGTLKTLLDLMFKDEIKTKIEKDWHTEWNLTSDQDSKSKE